MKSAYVVLALIAAAVATPTGGGTTKVNNKQNPSCSAGFKPTCCNGKLNCIVLKSSSDPCSGSTYCCQTNQQGTVNVALIPCNSGGVSDNTITIGNIGKRDEEDLE